MSYLATVDVEFNTVMKNDFDLNLIDDSVVDIYVRPSNQRQNEDDLIEASKNLNLTWVVDSFQDKTLRFDITFNNSYEISQNMEQDDLIVHFKDLKTYFISKKFLKDLDQNYTTLKTAIPKQVEKTEFNLELVSGV